MEAIDVCMISNHGEESLIKQLHLAEMKYTKIISEEWETMLSSNFKWITPDTNDEKNTGTTVGALKKTAVTWYQVKATVLASFQIQRS